MQRNLGSWRRGSDLESVALGDGRSRLIDSDSVLALCARNAAIDAECLQLLAEEALQRRDIASYKAALAAYESELIPEEGNEGWRAERAEPERAEPLRELRDRLALGLAEALERCRADDEAATPAPRRAATPGLSPPASAPARKRRLIRFYADNRIRALAGRRRKGEQT